MKAAPLPANENLRLATLRRYFILDTPPEARFDELTRLAAQVCDTPIALINLIDEQRQWSKSVFGNMPREIPREVSFCAYTILEAEGLVIQDLAADSRFRDHPMVVGEPYLRFYAAMPLIGDGGYALGTLSVLDYRPRELSSFQLQALRVLSHQVAAQLLLHGIAAGAGEKGSYLNAEKQLSESQANYRDIFENTSDMIHIVTTEGRILAVNPAWKKTMGYSDDEISKMSIRDLIPAEEHAAQAATMARIIADASSGIFERTLVAKDGSKVRVEGNFSAQRDGAKVIAIRVIFRDITARKAIEDKLRESEALYRALFENTSDAVFIFNLDGTIITANQPATRLLGYSVEELRGMYATENVHPDEHDDVERRLALLNAGEVPIYYERTLRNRDGIEIPVEVNAALVKDELGRPHHIQSIVRNIGRRKQQEQQLAYLSNHDYLTNLANRRVIESRLTQLLERVGTKGNGILLFIDLDRFKPINDTPGLGHEAGDMALRYIADLLKRELRHSDTIARLGGDEFAALLERTTLEQALQIARRLCKAVAKRPFAVGEYSFPLGFSIGVVELAEFSDANSAIHCADMAMYRAKQAGGGRVAVWGRPGV